MKITKIYVDINSGWYYYNAFTAAVELARSQDAVVVFSFKGYEFEVTGDSCWDGGVEEKLTNPQDQYNVL